MMTESAYALLDLLPISAIVTDTSHNILFYNKRALAWQKDLNEAQQQKLFQDLLCAEQNASIEIKEDTVVKVCRRDYEADGTCCRIYFMMDITENEEIRNNQLIYKECLDSISDLSIFACDQKGKILLYNAASAKNDGKNKEDVIGKSLYDIFSTKTETAIRYTLSTGEPILDYESVYTTAEGKTIWNLGSAYPIKKSGKMIGAFSINRTDDKVRKLLMSTLALQKKLLSPEGKARSNGTVYSFDDIIGNSISISRTINFAKRISLSNTMAVLIYGETGVGKELFAQSIHNESYNHSSPFVAINCAAIPTTLLESTLFGTTKGAFTGAVSTEGLFEQAKDGTLFLDEINSMPLELQAKILRVLQERVVRRVGSNEEIPVRCRVISSTNVPPRQCIENQSLRADLYFRLSAVTLEIPPLRERKEDIPVLAEHWIQKYARIYGHPLIKVQPEFYQELSSYPWPGNVRELIHVIEHTVILLNPEEELSVGHIPTDIRKSVHRTGTFEPVEEETIPENLTTAIEKYERRMIEKALKATQGNLTRAAKMIGYTRQTLQYKVGKYEIQF